MKIVGISGGLTSASRTTQLVRKILEKIDKALPIIHSVQLIELAKNTDQLAGVIWRHQAGAALEAQLSQIETADLLVVACPVYRTSYPGLFKHFLDLIERKGFEKKLVVLGACGGSTHHALIIEQQLRPLMSNLGAFTAPTGLFAEAKDIAPDLGISAPVLQRIDRLVEDVEHFFAVGNNLAQVDRGDIDRAGLNAVTAASVVTEYEL